MFYLNEETFQREIECFFIKKERKKQNYSLEKIAEKIGKSKQYISDIENGKRYNKRNIKEIFEILNINCNYQSSIGEDIVNHFEDYIHYHISMNKEERINCEKFLLDKNSENIYCYPILTLTKFISNYIAEKEDDLLSVKMQCDEIYNLFTNSQKSIYYYFLGIYYWYDKNNITQGEYYLKKSLDFDSNSEIAGMAYNQMGIIYCLTNQLHDAYKMQIKSIELLEKNSCYKRTIYPKTSIADIYMKMGFEKECERCYLDVIKLCKQFKMVKSLNVAQFNLAYGMMILKNYDKAIKYAQELKEVDYYQIEYNYILAWSYFHLNETKIANNYLSKLKEINDHKNIEIDTYAICLNYLLNGKHELYYKKLSAYYQSIKNNLHNFDTIIALEWLIEYCREHQKYEEGFQYQQEYIQLIKKR